ncbi:MAG: RimK family alpha-L-glutamate ligase [Methylococcales bacterium]|nr:RimK family alpha-L-glutamate ligase [Methylococcales bacterium]
MRRIAIFTEDAGWHGKQLTQAFSKVGYQADYVSLTDCQIQIHNSALPIQIKGFETTLPDGVFVRGVAGGSLQEVVFYLDILHGLKELNIPVYNDAYAIERSVDKGMTSFLLKKAGVPTPDTWVLRDRDMALTIAEQQLAQGNYLISKPVFGSQGEGLRRLEKQSDLLWLTASNGIYYLQRFINSLGDDFSDMRVFVINGQAVAGMCRRGQSWLNNVARGARCEPLELSPILSSLAVKATQALTMNYAGVDIIQDKKGNYLVIEVNSIPAWKGLESVCNLNIATLLVNDMLNL